ncbi:MAG TPA: hypothetical protein VGO47_14670 [Chlamydiales bacterium]|nr:hypothetical protein [Chlamydiales bacterium]
MYGLIWTLLRSRVRTETTRLCSKESSSNRLAVFYNLLYATLFYFFRASQSEDTNLTRQTPPRANHQNRRRGKRRSNL